MRRPLRIAGALAALALSACGSSEVNPPPAEPASSPPLTEKPEGRVVPLGAEAEGVVVDGPTGLAAVATRDPDRLTLIDLRDGEVRKRVELPGPARHLAPAQGGRAVLVPIEYEDLLLRVSLPDGGVTQVRTGDFPHDAVETANGRTFVGDEGGDTITVLEGSSPIDTLAAPEQPGGLAATKELVAVVAVAARELALFDAGSLARVATLPAGAGPSHVVAAEDGRLYVADTGGDAVLVYDTVPEDGGEPRLVDRANVPGSPYGLALDERRDRLWVTQTARNRVAELEITDLAPKLIAEHPTVRQPNSVGVDPRTGAIVVVGRSGGQVQLLRPGEEG